MIDEIEIYSLAEGHSTEKDDTGKTYTKTFYYMENSVRISLKTVKRLRSRIKAAEDVYWAILTELPTNKYEVKISRASIKKFTGLSDASISLAIKALTTLTKAEEDENKIIDANKKLTPKEKEITKYKPLIKVKDDVYRISVAQCHKGNVDHMIRKEKELKKELDNLEKEKQESAKIHALTFKLRNKK